MRVYPFVGLIIAFLFATAIAQTRPGRTEIRRGIQVGPSTSTTQRQEMIAGQIARKIEPDLKGDPARLQTYVEFFKRESVRDPRLFACDIFAVANADGSIAIRGFVEYPAHRHALTLLLKTLGFNEIEDAIEEVPTAQMRQHPLGIVKATRVFLYDRTTEPRETVSECLAGETVFLLRRTDDGYYWVHNIDGYVGYVSLDAIDRMDSVPALRRGERAQEQIEAAISAASKLIGTPYVWGGRTAAGVDCSGLAQLAYRSQGINLPRDADQQALIGRFVATNWYRKDMARGDLMFFISRRGTIGHVAIYLGDDKFLESADEGVKISSLKPLDEDYEPRRDLSFAFARRVIE